MSLMGTLAKIAIGYAAARGVDRLSGEQGLGTLIGGKAQIPGSEPGTSLQAQMGKMLGGSGNPLGAIMEQLKKSGFGGLPGMEQAGQAASTGLAGMLAAAAKAANMGGKNLGDMLDKMSASQAAAPEAESAAGLMLRAMIQAAKADGDIDAAEKAKLTDTLGADASAEDIAFLKAQLAAKLDPEALAKDTPDAQKTQVYAASLMAITVDTPKEAEYLDRLAKAMGLPETAVNALHMQMGLQPLYA
ncbi:tellurite resistance TerB family protein [Salipiger mangrovisoli]|uniref:Tellurite resistance TerB family protein n=1 Tax=Salipiger mangrovisoli TaxID=2865933 RepID=A0ABR9X3R3_9RHOB|nr:tellurite resistance TerB family protein [Salipiger mangrovisoli]MBE9638092.1 tellurite resistance TerB family protein [Salipiger mangrovisoli]